MPKNRITTGILQPREETGKLLTPDNLAGEVFNMRITDEGTLRSLEGPTPWLPAVAGQGGLVYPSPQAEMHGIYHHAFDNRDMLLLHSGAAVYVFEGWKKRWGGGVPGKDELLKDATTALLQTRVPNFKGVCAPTQFEGVPNGVVIVPQEGRAYFFDGEAVGALGYSNAPSSPVGNGPSAYNHTVDNMFADEFSRVCFGFGRVGTVSPYLGQGAVAAADGGDTALGMRLKGSYMAATRWIDRWGNMSPMSQTSAEILIPSKNSIGTLWSDGTTAESQHMDWTPSHILWESVEVDTAPDSHTIGRILYRTKDTKNSGQAGLFEVPANAGSGALYYATMPDNISSMFPDNTSDEQLLTTPTQTIGVPEFRYCKLAFGVLFIADKQTVRWSRPSFWGTFGENSWLVPDASGAEITGFANTPSGLVVFTELSTFLINQNQDGTGYTHQTLSSSSGCVAPSSIQVTSDGTAIWLGREGFYALAAGGQPELISAEIKTKTRYINSARTIQATSILDPKTGEYRCWVPFQGSRTNNRCFIFDGGSWRESQVLTEVKAACVTKDHRAYTLVAGTARGTTTVGATTDYASTAGVYLLDHEVFSFKPQARESKIRTTWIGSADAARKSPKRVTIWLRECHSSPLTVTLYRDWRKKAVQVDATTVKLYSPEDVPPFWGSTELDGASSWKKRRPYWTKVDIDVPSCEVFSIELGMTADAAWEFIGLEVEEVIHSSSHRIPR